jgi:RHS repeat-associated protein
VEGGAAPYYPARGQQVHASRRARCRPRRKLVRGGALWRFVCRHLLDFRWSPEQIAATLTRTHPDDPARFPGQWFQTESGLHQIWMRDYDPTTERYLEPDPLGLVDGASVYGVLGRVLYRKSTQPASLG